MSKDRRLGRGLAALLGTEEEAQLALNASQEGTVDHAFQMPNPSPGNPPSDSHAQRDGEDTGILQLNADEIDSNPFQPRRDFHETEIASLAESLKEHEMLQPVLVRRTGERFQLISGERRLRAAIAAGWTQIPARLREADDQLVAELAIVENLQRKDLNPIEKALSFKRYLDQHHCPQEELANRLKIDRSTVANLMRLLELPSPVIDAVRAKQLTAGHARALLPLGDERMQTLFCEHIQEHDWSVRETERQVAARIDQEDQEPLRVVSGSESSQKERKRNDQIAALEQELRNALGTKVDIRQNAKGRGKIAIHFVSNQEFERIRTLLTEPHAKPQRHIG